VKNDNPWDATTLDWQTPTPPPHGNFTRAIKVYRGPYEYSVPGHAADFTPQNEPPDGLPAPAISIAH
jgi:cytochrome c oxidase subunit 1